MAPSQSASRVRSSPETFAGSVVPLPRRFPAVFGAGEKRAVLGLGALTHDTSAALVSSSTGEVLYAAPEERVSNTKHDSTFPIGALLRCCQTAAASGYVIERVAVNFDPSLYLPGIVEQDLRAAGVDAPRSETFLRGLERVAELGEPFDLARDSTSSREVAKLLDALEGVSPEDRRSLVIRLSWYLNVAIKYRRLAKLITALFEGVPVRFVCHHDCHAATAHFGSGFSESAVLVIDGHGEQDTTSIYHGTPSGLRRVGATSWPHSLGSFYLAITRYLGYEYGDEYKVMGMSAYGTPRYLEEMKAALDVSEDGTVAIRETPYFGIGSVRGFGQRRFEIRPAFHEKCPPRQPGGELSERHFDLAASGQALLELLGVDLARAARRLTGVDRLAMAGGVALNGLMNEAIRRSGEVSDLFVYPAASDDGTSAGAALWLLIESGVLATSRMNRSYYGYRPADGEIESALAAAGARWSRPPSIHRQIAEAVAAGQIVARYTGASEYGPRALGNRSILANPARADMKDVLNLRVKHREQFRPFAPACLREHVGEYFEIETDAPFMIMIVRAKEIARQRIPSVVHRDGTARVQTVTEEQSPDFHRILRELFALTGIPVVINTSFNVNGEAIVDTPRDALESFAFMDIDYLALGDYWIAKEENAGLLPALSHDDYLAIRRTRYAETVEDSMTTLDVRRYEPWFYPRSDSVDAFLAGEGR